MVVTRVVSTWFVPVLRRCMSRAGESGPWLQALLAVTAPGLTEAFLAWAAGLGAVGVARILCWRVIDGAQQWLPGLGALVPLRVRSGWR